MTIKIVYGGGSLGPNGDFSTDAQVKEAMDLLLSLGITELDTARVYSGSEEAIGRQPNHTSFNIGTKLVCGYMGISVPTKETTIKDSLESFGRFKIPQFDILYLHGPNTEVPVEETLEGINEVFKKGIFKRFGLSNFTAEQVKQAYAISKEKGYVLPSVYQGNYNPVAQLNICFYAYSPIAGGFLFKTVADIHAGAGRFNDAAYFGLYKKMYDKPSMRAVLDEWNAIAKGEGISKVELAYRWVANDSILEETKENGVVFGARTLEQIEQTAGFLKKGGLSASAKERIEAIWQSVKGDAPVDNVHY